MDGKVRLDQPEDVSNGIIGLGGRNGWNGGTCEFVRMDNIFGMDQTEELLKAAAVSNEVQKYRSTGV